MVGRELDLIFIDWMGSVVVVARNIWYGLFEDEVVDHVSQLGREVVEAYASG